MKKIIIILITLFITLQAQDFKKTGTAGFTFLGIPVSARSAAMGEASISLSDFNSTSVFTNPAALGFSVRMHSLSVSYSPWFASINHYSTAYSFNSGFGVFGLGISFLDYGTMDKTYRLSGQRVYEQAGTFGANAMSLGLTYSRQLTDKFSFGITAKYVQEKIDIYTAGNVLMDDGFLFFTGLGSLRLGVVVQNFGTDAKFKNSTFKMPVVMKLGAAAEVLESNPAKVTLIAEAIHPTDAVERVNIGTEITLYNMLSLRGGYKFFYDEETYSIGVGFKTPDNYALPADVSFSLSDYGVLGKIIRLSLEVGL